MNDDDLTDDEKRAIARIATETDPEKLWTYIRNAMGKSPAVVTAAHRRLVELEVESPAGTVENACRAMILTTENIRREKGKPWRMNYTRRKIGKDGAVATLEYCALNRTPGFDEVLSYDLPEMTAEAIVLRHPGHFSEAAKTAARRRLAKAGIEVDESGAIVRGPMAAGG